MSQQAAPANYPPRRSSTVRDVKRNRRPRVNDRAWVVCGSRLFSRVSAVFSVKTKIGGVNSAHAKAAPVQAVGGCTSHERANASRGRRRGRVGQNKERPNVSHLAVRTFCEHFVRMNGRTGFPALHFAPGHTKSTLTLPFLKRPPVFQER